MYISGTGYKWDCLTNIYLYTILASLSFQISENRKYPIYIVYYIYHSINSPPYKTDHPPRSPVIPGGLLEYDLLSLSSVS